MRILPALAFVAAFVLSGCSGGDSPPDEAQLEEQFDELDLQATATTGVIRGLVVDDAIKPVAGAKVVLNGVTQTATSDEDGLFGFQDLDAGTYFLQVSKNGYRPTQQSAEVLAGVADPAILKVLLQVDPSTLAYVEVHQYEGYLQCSFKAANQVFDPSWCDPAGATGLSANDDSMPWFPITRQPDYYQSEMSWESTQPAGTGLVTIQWACNEGDCGDDDYRLCNVRGQSPLTCRVNRTASLVEGGGGVGIEEAEFGTENMGYMVQMFANCFECVPGTVLGAGVVLEQRFQIYNHLFYGYEPPAEWTFLVDGAPPPPPA
jgi:Carboxypeptidase regulatory-like domain